MSPRVRLPLVELGAHAKAAVASTLAQLSDEYSHVMIGAFGAIRSARRAVAG
jgi:hypothetical protein